MTISRDRCPVPAWPWPVIPPAPLPPPPPGPPPAILCDARQDTRGVSSAAQRTECLGPWCRGLSNGCPAELLRSQWRLQLGKRPSSALHCFELHQLRARQFARSLCYTWSSRLPGRSPGSCRAGLCRAPRSERPPMLAILPRCCRALARTVRERLPQNARQIGDRRGGLALFVTAVVTYLPATAARSSARPEDRLERWIRRARSNKQSELPAGP